MVNTVTMVEFRQKAEKIIEQVIQGQRFVLTYRGKPVMRLEPVEDGPVDDQDPFYSLADLADPAVEPVDNDGIDRILYGA